VASSLREIEEFSSPQDQFMTQQEAIDELINRGQPPIDYKYGGNYRQLTDPFIGERRPILRQEQSMIVGYNSDGSANILTIPAQYGPPEFDSSYSPARRGLSKLNDVFFGNANEQSAALSGITEALRAVPEYLKGQYDAGMGGGTVFNPETQQIQEFDPTAVMLGGAPAGLKAVRNIPSNQVILGTMGSKTAKYTPDQRRAMDELESQGMDTENLFLHGTSDDIRQPSSWKTGYRDSGWIGEGFYGVTPDGSRISDFYANTAAPRFRNEAGDYSDPNVFPYITKRGNYKQYSLMDKAGMGIVAQRNPDYSKNLTQKNIDEGFIGAEVIDGEGQIVERVNYFPDTDTRSALNYDTTDLASKAVKAGGKKFRSALRGLEMNPEARMARADEQGLTKTLYHGTHADIEEFDPNMVDIGTHLGTSEQANERLKDVYRSRNGLSTFVGGDEVASGANVMPVRANLGKSLEMNDVGMWSDSEKVISELEDMPEFRGKFDGAWEELGVKDSYEDVQDWWDSPENREMLDEINAEIRRQGYDSIRYANQVENKYGNLAGTRPEVAARKKTLNDELKAIDLSGRHRPREAPTIEDVKINPNAVEEWVKEFDVKASYSPQQEQRMIQINQELKSLDELNKDDIYSYIILDPKNIRSTNAEFDPTKADSSDLLSSISPTQSSLRNIA
jgi:hypothetical protein